jgi:hypothetical protein
MLIPKVTRRECADGFDATVFQALGGEMRAVDLWTRVDFSWMHAGAKAAAEAVGYRGLPMAYRVAGITIGGDDAALNCPPFIVEIHADRVSAQAVWTRNERGAERLVAADDIELSRWTAGSLSQGLRMAQYADNDVGVEAELHIADSISAESLREFVSAFSWDVAALHAYATDGQLLPTDEWVKRSALSISRSTPRIPLRDASTDIDALESPRGLFLSLQPSGGLCEAENVLYLLRAQDRALEPITALPGHRRDWDYARFTDVWLSRNEQACVARTILCEGFVNSSSGSWRAIEADAITAVALLGDDGFLLGLYDGVVQTLDRDLLLGSTRCIDETASGRFAKLAAHDGYVVGVIGDRLVGAPLDAPAEEEVRGSRGWSYPFAERVSIDGVCELDVDHWPGGSGIVSLLGDNALLLTDLRNEGDPSVLPIEAATHAVFVDAGTLLVAFSESGSAGSRLQLLDCRSLEWSGALRCAPVTRLAVRGEEIHVGFSSQTVAVWGRRVVLSQLRTLLPGT